MINILCTWGKILNLYGTNEYVFSRNSRYAGGYTICSPNPRSGSPFTLHYFCIPSHMLLARHRSFLCNIFISSLDAICRYTNLFIILFITVGEEYKNNCLSPMYQYVTNGLQYIYIYTYLYTFKCKSKQKRKKERRRLTYKIETTLSARLDAVIFSQWLCILYMSEPISI